MNRAKIWAFLAILATIWGAVYMHDRAYRYEIVGAGAGSGGSGGSQESTGEVGTTEIAAYVLDRTTGKVWFIDGRTQTPTVLLTCQDIGGSDGPFGCRMKK